MAQKQPNQIPTAIRPPPPPLPPEIKVVANSEVIIKITYPTK